MSIFISELDAHFFQLEDENVRSNEGDSKSGNSQEGLEMSIMRVEGLEM